MAGGTPSPCSWILLASRAFASHGTLSQSHVPLVQALTRIVAIDGTVMVPAARPPAQLLARTTMAHSLKRKNHAPAAAPRIESPETSNLSPPLHPGPPPNVVEFDAADAHVMNGHARVAIPPNVPQAEVVTARETAARDGDVVPKAAAVAGPCPGERGGRRRTVWRRTDVRCRRRGEKIHRRLGSRGRRRRWGGAR